MQKIYVDIPERPDIKGLYYMDTPNVLFINTAARDDGVFQILRCDENKEAAQ